MYARQALKEAHDLANSTEAKGLAGLAEIEKLLNTLPQEVKNGLIWPAACPRSNCLMRTTVRNECSSPSQVEQQKNPPKGGFLLGGVYY